MVFLTKEEKKYVELYRNWAENMGRLLLDIKNLNERTDLTTDEKLNMHLPLIEETDLAFKAINNLEETYINSETLKKMKYEGKYGLPSSYKTLTNR